MTVRYRTGEDGIVSVGNYPFTVSSLGGVVGQFNMYMQNSTALSIASITDGLPTGHFEGDLIYPDSSSNILPAIFV